MKEININHDVWLKKYNKTKSGKIFNLMHDIQFAVFSPSMPKIDRLSHLSSALLIATRGTKLEADCVEIIKMLNPEFFTDEKTI